MSIQTVPEPSHSPCGEEGYHHPKRASSEDQRGTEMIKGLKHQSNEYCLRENGNDQAGEELGLS